jgi:hypothetical protein
MRTALALLLTTSAACSSSTSYDEAWGASETLPAKADDFAEPIAFGQVKAGKLDEDALRVFKIRLHDGDKIEGVLRITSGDLRPDFTLFRGLTTSIRSTDFEVTTKRLEKTYELEDEGEFVFVVRAFQHQGEGEFAFELTCTGGPCAGEATPIDAGEADACLHAAQACAFDKLPDFDGAVGPARARTIFQACLQEVREPGGKPCDEACTDADPDEDSTRREVCDDVIRDLPFFADASAACLRELDDCMDPCLDLGDDLGGDPSEPSLLGLPFATCWTFGFNGTCPGHARDMEACGGDLEADSVQACHSLCESTDGAWNDDLDTICTEACGDLPEE